MLTCQDLGAFDFYGLDLQLIDLDFQFVPDLVYSLLFSML